VPVRGFEGRIRLYGLQTACSPEPSQKSPSGGVL